MYTNPDVAKEMKLALLSKYKRVYVEFSLRDKEQIIAFWNENKTVFSLD